MEIKTTNSTEEYFKHYDELLSVMEKNDMVNFEKVFTEVGKQLNSIESFDTNNKEIKDNIQKKLDKTSNWILNNFSSSKLVSILNLISNFLLKCGYLIEVSKLEIIKSLNLDMIEIKEEDLKEIEDTPDISKLESPIEKKKISKENIDKISMENTILTSQFLNTFYALAITISNKPDIILKSRYLVRTCISVFSQIADIENVVIYIKKKRLISIFFKIIKELNKNKDSTDHKEQFNKNLKIFLCLFAKIGKNRLIYRDYMFKKSIPDLMLNFIESYTEDTETLNAFCTYCIYSVRKSDHKTFFWTKNVPTVLLDKLSSIMQSIENAQYKSKEDDKHSKVNSDMLKKDSAIDEKTTTNVALILLALANLSKDNYDIQCEVQESTFYSYSSNIMINFSKNNLIIYSLISILRRISDKEFLNQISKEFLYTFLALLDFYYVNVKERIPNKFSLESDNKKEYYVEYKNKEEEELDLTILKEITALLGNLMIIEENVRIFYEKNLQLILVDNIISFINYPKIVKICVGTLINLTSREIIRDSLGNVAAYIQSLKFVMETYKTNSAITDYLLKLLVNSIKNTNISKALVSEDIFLYLLLFIKNFKDENIILNTIKILRALLINRKSYGDFLIKLVEFYEMLLINDNNTNNFQELNIYSLFLNDMILLIDTQIENSDVCVEVLLLICYLTSQGNNEFKHELENNSNFIKIISKLTQFYHEDEEKKKILAQTIAYFPIEEMQYNKDD